MGPAGCVHAMPPPLPSAVLQAAELQQELSKALQQARPPARIGASSRHNLDGGSTGRLASSKLCDNYLRACLLSVAKHWQGRVNDRLLLSSCEAQRTHIGEGERGG